ncbi:MAG: peptide-methionine (R)-S-oxide reductase MsrB [Rhizobiales bacterium]|nr:peptide-methionine (R)-S-oxide reductase MsrB [Hyphomicrobiales bacterium]
MMDIDRRTLLALGGLGAFVMLVPALTRSPVVHASSDIEKLVLTEEEWRERLSQEAYAVLRTAGTEYPWTSPLNDEKRDGNYHCAGCDLVLFTSETKFDSGTGWPSFYAPYKEEHLGTKTDYLIGYPRTEYHCARCGGHHGHVFRDGPAPTGLRYCNNGVALTFKPGPVAS